MSENVDFLPIFFDIQINDVSTKRSVRPQNKLNPKSSLTKTFLIMQSRNPLCHCISIVRVCINSSVRLFVASLIGYKAFNSVSCNFLFPQVTLICYQISYRLQSIQFRILCLPVSSQHILTLQY
jgi:hypothetical protein